MTMMRFDRAGHTDIVRILLWGDEVDPCADDNYAIRKASENGHTDIVQILLACADMDPSVKDNYAIRKARKHGHTEIVQMLLAYNSYDERKGYKLFPIFILLKI